MKKYFREHKFVSALIILSLIAVGYYGLKAWTSPPAETRYVLAKVERGTLVSSVTGTGQVSTSNQIDLKSKVSSDIVYIGAVNGQAVATGQIIIKIDDRDAQKAVRDAEVNLASAKLAWEKTKLQQGQQLRGDTLNKNYEDGLAVLANFYGEFSSTLDALDTIFFDDNLSGNQQTNIGYYSSYNKIFANAPARSRQLYQETQTLYQQALIEYQSAKRGGGEERAKAIQDGYALTVKAAELIKTGRDAVRYLKDALANSDSVHTKQSIIDGHAADLTTYATSIDTYLQDLLTIANTINNQRDTIDAYPLDNQSQELTITQRENALLDARENLADYSIRAPFNGLITKLDIKKTDSVSNGTIIGTLITKQKIAEISLNEVDVARVKVDNQATLTFDAIDGLKITGVVQEVDLIGTITQGVVTYNVKISFDAQDNQVKAGMTASAEIIIETRPDILLVPNSAIKTAEQRYYVERFDPSFLSTNNIQNRQGFLSAIPPHRQTIEIGSANDEVTEVANGLDEGDEVVVRTITAPVTPASSRAPSIFGPTGGRRPQ